MRFAKRYQIKKDLQGQISRRDTQDGDVVQRKKDEKEEKCSKKSDSFYLLALVGANFWLLKRGACIC